MVWWSWLASNPGDSQVLTCAEAAGWWGQVIRWLAAEPWGTWGLCWPTGGWNQGPGGRGAVASPLVGRIRAQEKGVPRPGAMGWGPTDRKSQVLQSGPALVSEG